MSLGFTGIRLRVMKIFVPRALFSRSAIHAHVTIPHWPPQTIPLGKKLLKRRFDFAGCSVEMPGRIVWNVASASEDWHRQFYSFWWLSELNTGKHNREAASFAREFVNCFILEKREQPAVAWDPDVAGLRLYHWLEYFDFLIKGSSKAFRQRFARSLLQHVLVLTPKLSHHASPELVAGLLAANRKFNDFSVLMPELTKALKTMLPGILYPDGSHRSASPQQHLHTLKQLINIRNLLSQDNLMYADLTMALQKMGTMLQFFTHADGRLALFNDSIMDDAAMITKVFERSGASEIFPVESDAGFCHLRRKKTSVIMQVSAAPNPVNEGMLSFELSDGPNRIVVNCGHYLGTDNHWLKAVRSAAAHSTLSLASDPLPVVAKESDGPAAMKEEHPLDVASDAVLTGEQFNHVFVSAFSEHYATSHGLRHKRYLKLSAKGDKLSGTDTVLREAVEPAMKGDLRFHLHPDIRTAKISEQKVQLSTLSGNAWYFETAAPLQVHIEESIYLGHNGRPQKTLQLVIKLEFKEPQTETLWSFTRKSDTPLISA